MNIFTEKSCRKYAAKASPRPLFINLVNKPKQPLHAKIILKVKYFERGLSKSPKKGNFTFSAKPSKQNYQEQERPGTSDQLLFRLRNKFRKIPLLVMHYLTKLDDLM